MEKIRQYKKIIVTEAEHEKDDEDCVYYVVRKMVNYLEMQKGQRVKKKQLVQLIIDGVTVVIE